MTLFLFASNYELSMHLNVFVPERLQTMFLSGLKKGAKGSVWGPHV